jgi:hypothetical protein
VVLGTSWNRDLQGFEQHLSQLFIDRLDQLTPVIGVRASDNERSSDVHDTCFGRDVSRGNGTAYVCTQFVSDCYTIVDCEFHTNTIIMTWREKRGNFAF